MDVAAVSIFVGILLYVAIMYGNHKISLAGVAVFLGAGIFAICAIPNLTHISHLLVKAGEYFSMSLDAQQPLLALKTTQTMSEK